MKNIGDSAVLNVFRNEVRDFLERALTADLRAEGRRQIGVFSPAAVGRSWHRVLFEKGWITPTWPVEYGGIGWTSHQKYIFEQECARAETPTLSSAALLMCGPILIKFGTPKQQARFLPRLRSGEDYWCQGYSEQGAGSDLAALTCRATCGDDNYVIDGTKLWTTHAHNADWIFMLVRTSRSEKPQQGITFILVDMRSPGITIKPIISMSGQHEVNQVFFDQVLVPVANRIGQEGAGWEIAKRLLEFERSGVYGPRIRRIMRRTARLARSNAGLWQQPDFRRRYAALAIEVDALESSELRLIFDEGSQHDATTSSLLKLAGTETMQRASELCVAAAGTTSAYRFNSGGNDETIEEGVLAMARHLDTRAATIYGGSSEIQRNILAKVALGL